MDKMPAEERKSDKEQNEEDRLGLEAVSAMCKAAHAKFDRIDKDSSGYLSKLELEEAAASPKFSLLERRQFKLLSEHSDVVQQVSHNGWQFRPDTYGIHKRDLVGLMSFGRPMYVRLEEQRALREVLTRNLAKIDTDGNGEMSGKELDIAQKSLDIDHSDRLALKEAASRWKSISYMSTITEGRAISPAYIDQNIKDITDRNGSVYRYQKTMWAIADALRPRK